MGANQVKLWKEMTAEEAAASEVNLTKDSGEGSGRSTPTRPSSLKTLPPFKDPRSPPPDAASTRTPIQVEATPGAKNSNKMFDDTPLMQKVLRRGPAENLVSPTTPLPATPVKNLDLSSSFEGPDSKENVPGDKPAESTRTALFSKNK